MVGKREMSSATRKTRLPRKDGTTHLHISSTLSTITLVAFTPKTMKNIRNLFSNQNQNPIPSSSPAFATPVHPIRPRNVDPVSAPQLKPTILPILLPPATLRPHAFRTLTNKYNLNFRPSALVALATFIGRHCGSGWREEGLAEGVLEEVARNWKKLYGETIIDGDGDNLKNILKSLETFMVGGKVVQGKSSLSRQGSFAVNGIDGQEKQIEVAHRAALQSETSFGMSSLDVNDEEDDEASKDPRDWLKLIDAYSQPRLTYNATKKHFERYIRSQTIVALHRMANSLQKHFQTIAISTAFSKNRALPPAISPSPPAHTA